MTVSRNSGVDVEEYACVEVSRILLVLVSAMMPMLELELELAPRPELLLD